MAFGPGTTTGTDLTRKGSLKAQWPETAVLENLKGLDADVEARPVINADAAVFDLANSDGNLLRHNFAAAVQDGTLGTNQVSVQLGSVADTVRATADKEKEERRKQDETLRFMRVMKALNDRLAELEKEMADLAVKLRAKYGEDFIGGMAAAHLSEEELGRARSKEDHLKMLAEKFLESDGKGGYKVKEEYKDSDEAQFVSKWKNSEKLKGIVAEVENSGVTDNKIEKLEQAFMSAGFDAVVAVDTSLEITSSIKEDRLKDIMEQNIVEKQQSLPVFGS